MSGKTSGLGDNFYVGGYDLSGSVASLDKIACPMGPLDVTGIKSSAHERIGGLRDGEMDWTMFLDYDASVSPYWQDALHSLPTTDTVACYLHGNALGNAAAAVNGKQVNYDPTRDNKGNLTFKVQVLGNSYGLEWGDQLTAGLRTDTTATTGTDVDEIASSSHGAQAYIQVTSVVGTSATVKIRHSSDNSTYADLITFSTVNAGSVLAERQAVTGTVDRYLEVVSSGTFTSLTFAIVWVRNAAAVSF